MEAFCWTMKEATKKTQIVAKRCTEMPIISQWTEDLLTLSTSESAVYRRQFHMDTFLHLWQRFQIPSL